MTKTHSAELRHFLWGALAAILRDQRDRTVTNNVIEYREKPVLNVKKSFENAVKNANLPKWFTPHVLKHSVIPWLAEDGWNVDRIADFTNTNATTVKRIYRKVNPENLREMSESLGFYVTPLDKTNVIPLKKQA